MFIGFRTQDADPGPFRIHHGSVSDGTQYAIVFLGDGIDLHLHSAADCDALIAAAVEAKRLLSPPVIEPACAFIREYDGQIYPCVLGDDHADEHQDRLGARWWHGEDDSQTVTHAAPRVPEPVITDSGRTCDERNPDGSGEPCHRGGDHGVHRDANGDEWRTDLGNILDELPQAGQ